MVEIKPGTPESEIFQLKRKLQKMPFVKVPTLRFISKEEGAELLRDDLGEEFLKLDFQNPLYDILSFNVHANYLQSDSLQQIRSQIIEWAGVNDLFYQEAMVDEVGKNIQKIGVAVLFVSLFFIIIAVALIHNTIRLTLYANRFLIKNMELVGASWRFISRPYLWTSLKNGLYSGLIAVIALGAVWWFIALDIPELSALNVYAQYGVLFIALILLGILINTISTYYIVNKYLKMRLDDLY
ncbi:MAG: permease-like cell division protein FtsX [Bacteroidota bacterium]